MWFNLYSTDLLDSLVDQVVPLIDVRRQMSVSIHSLVRATGMNYLELNDFLNSNNIEHVGFATSYDAIDALKDWYLKRMRRYLRNGLAYEFEPGSIDEILFLRFCVAYRKFGHYEVTSWDDIDEFRLLHDFENSCLNEDLPFFTIEPKGNETLLSRIHRSFLFYLRLKKSPKHNPYQARTILSIILCNRYHIFTGEADSNTGYTLNRANGPCKLRINPPRSNVPYGLAS